MQWGRGCGVKLGLLGGSLCTHTKTAFEHYLTHDRCLAGTLNALGYSCRETLTAWIEELRPGVRHRVIGKGVGVQHSPELKKAAFLI